MGQYDCCAVRGRNMPNEGKLIAGAIIAAAILLVWTFRYETVGIRRLQHQNRLTGAVCQISEECWFP
jgi:hypothetical protein